MDLKSDENIREKAIKFFCRHLVGLSVAYRHKTEEDAAQPPRFTTCSGTLIIIEGVVCYLTAGHVLKKLDELRSSAKVEIVSASLADTFGWKRISEIPIPFDLKNAALSYIDDEEAGLDFGVIMLEPSYARLLAKNGIVALTKERWLHQSSVKFDGYAILGFPDEFTSDRVSSSGAAFVSPTICGVKKLDRTPDGRTQTLYPQFIGQLGTTFSLKSLEGMSGGPIFGFRQESNGEFRYWVVALQSSWIGSTKVTFGSSLPVLASLMTEWAEERAPAA